MKTELKVFYLGRYNPGEILTGPEKAAKRVFNICSKSIKAEFIEYFFDGRKFGIFKKLFGSETVMNDNGSIIKRLGLFALLIYLFRNKPTTIHIITYERFALMCFVYKIMSGVRIVTGFQGNVHHENINYKKCGAAYRYKDYFCEKIFLKFSDKIFFLSEKSAQISCKYHKFNKNKIEIIPNGIDEVFHEYGKSKSFRGGDELKLVFIGDIIRMEKGFKLLVRALQMVSFRYKLYTLSNSGDALSSEFIPVKPMPTERLAEYLSDKDIYISTSEYEPFSIAAAEAMAEGLITVVTAQTGMSRYIRDGLDGFTFQYGDAEKLSVILNSISNTRNKFPEISGNAIQIYEKLSWEKIAGMYEVFYS